MMLKGICLVRPRYFSYNKFKFIMPRANRHFLPGYIWHITHRCHGKEFLLNDKVDREHWLSLLHKAKKRFEITVLGYAVTCNHIHLLIEDTGILNSIPKSMQLVQGQLAQSFNRRTGRINAFWGDRYFATAIESGIHLIRCLAYIDLNMVRAGVVTHPSQWRECGYNEIQNGRVRDGIINQHRLAALLDCKDLEDLKRVHNQIITETLHRDMLKRDERWTGSIAIGSRKFTERFAAELGDRLKSRAVIQIEKEDVFAVREESGAWFYSTNCEEKSIALRGDNEYEIKFEYL